MAASWNGYIKAVIVTYQQIFTILALAIFLSKISFKKRFKIVFCFGIEIGFWTLQFLTPLREVLLCFATQSLCKSHCSGCVKVAWSCSCVRNTILFCSWTVAGHRKLSWSGCIKAAIVTCQQIFSTLALVIFLVKFFLSFEKCFKIHFFWLWRRDRGFGAAISDAVARSSVGFGNSVFANRIVMAASRLLGAAAV